jgi:imidazole glycerol-phosphate synthase subunit HisF
MDRTRIIPVLLLDGTAAIKTRQFGPGRYIGDIVNAAQIFNDKMVDELIVVDVGVRRRRPSPPHVIRALAEECFMPLTFGGGVESVERAHELFRAGIEKVSINTAFVEGSDLIGKLVQQFGSQSVVASIDARRKADGSYQVYSRGGSRPIDSGPVAMARRAMEQGAGEILIQSIDRDGTRSGYDENLVGLVAASVSVPVVALGGADTLADLVKVMSDVGAAGAAAGSMFAFYGKLQAVLITYPRPDQRERAMASISEAGLG